MSGIDGRPERSETRERMPRIVLLSMLTLALTIPGSLQAQLASARVGVVHVPPPATGDEALGARLAGPEVTDESEGVHRVAIGAIAGAMIGAAATFLVVHHCEVHDTSHGDGPPCGIGYVVFGPFAVATGLALGAIIADVTQ